jgi:hypothetical protein
MKVKQPRHPKGEIFADELSVQNYRLQTVYLRRAMGADVKSNTIQCGGNNVSNPRGKESRANTRRFALRIFKTYRKRRKVHRVKYIMKTLILEGLERGSQFRLSPRDLMGTGLP